MLFPAPGPIQQTGPVGPAHDQRRQQVAANERGAGKKKNRVHVIVLARHSHYRTHTSSSTFTVFARATDVETVGGVATTRSRSDTNWETTRSWPCSATSAEG